MMKNCTNCKKEKDFSEFYRGSSYKDGLSPWCKFCYKAYRKSYYQEHKKYELAKNKTWRKNNPDYLPEWRKENSEKVRQYTQTSLAKHKVINKKRLERWRQENTERVKEYNRAWRKNNKEHVRNRSSKYRRCKFREDINFRIAITIRARLRVALKNNKKTEKFDRYMGCSIKELLHYLENKFQPRMSWENYGEWHIDHIRPLSSFDLSDIEQIKEACHYTNLQPLWAKDNLRKGSMIENYEKDEYSL